MTACKTTRVNRRADGTPAASWSLVLANIGLAYKLAARAAGCGLSVGDLRQEAALALHLAAGRFDPTRGLHFCTYAWRVVSNHLTTIIRRHCSQQRSFPSVGAVCLHLLAAPVRVGLPGLPDLSILDARERYVIERLFGLSGDEPATLREIAVDLGVCHKTVGRLRDRALARLRLDYGLPATEAA